MKQPSVYLETSFINRLADPLKRDPLTRQQQLTSRAWWSRYRRHYVLLSSEYAYDESCVKYKDERIVRLRLRRFAHLTIVRPPLADITELATALRKPRGPLPPKEILDSQHIAVAAISGCSYLLTWNQTHIANAFTQEIVDNIIERHGYQAPKIGTPEQFLAAPPE
jgi:hypothetical protein